MVGETVTYAAEQDDAQERDLPPAVFRVVLQKQLVHLHHWPEADGVGAKLHQGRVQSSSLYMERGRGWGGGGSTPVEFLCKLCKRVTPFKKNKTPQRISVCSQKHKHSQTFLYK